MKSDAARVQALHERTNQCYSLLAVLLAICAPFAAAQPYPNKAIRLLVAQAAGSASDIVARILGQKLSDALGQPVITDNRPGAGGLLGTELAAKAKPDGYTLFIATTSTHGVNPVLHIKVPYHPVTDFSPISLIASSPNVLVVHPVLPIRTVKQLIALAKSRPQKVYFSSPGKGSAQHLAIELFKSMAGKIDMVHVPYKGGPAAITAVITGEVFLMMPTLALGLPHITSQKVRPLGVTTLKRLPDLPQVPAIAETLPGYEVAIWFGLTSPAGTPKEVIFQLHREIDKFLALPDTRRTLAAAGLNAAASSPEQFGTLIKADLAKWTRVAKEAGVRLE